METTPPLRFLDAAAAAITTTLAPASNQTVVGAVVEDAVVVVSGVDWVLWAVGRLCELIVIVAAIVVICVFRQQIRKKFFEKCGFKYHDLCRHRYAKKCLKCICCCGCCGQVPALDKITHAENVLTVTLVAATDIKKKVPFFLEMWSEPAESTAKNSRTHSERASSCDLSLEKLELDWYGDEDELVIRTLTYHGQLIEDNENADVFGELRIPKNVVEKYAANAGGGNPEVSSVARSFQVQSVNLKARKKKKPSELSPLDRVIYQQLTDKLNIQRIDGDEHEKLVAENENLRTKVTAGGSNAGAFSSMSSDNLDATGAKTTVMKLVLMFQIAPKQASKFDINKFRSSSFGDQLHESEQLMNGQGDA